MIKKSIIYIIHLYQYLLSPDQGIIRYVIPNTFWHCGMYPSCSNYMILAIDKYGVFRGVLKGLRRITRCHPYQKQRVDFP